MKALIRWIAVPALFVAAVAHAQVKVDGAWVRATVPQQSGTGAFMALTSEHDSKLVKADSPVAKHVEIHEMAMENQVMKMRQIQALPLPAGQKVELKPGGYHIMFMGLHAQVKEGDDVPLTLTFESADGKRSTMEIVATARPLASGAHGHSHGQAQGQPHGHAHGHSDGEKKL